MTTTTNPGNYVDFDEYVGLKLERTRSTIRTTDLLTALAGVVAMFFGYLLVFVVLDQWVIRDGFGIAWRWFLLSILMISTVAWLVWKIGIPSFQTVNGLFAAKQIENAEPELKSNLLNLIDLKTSGRPVSPAILKAMERRAAVRLQEVDVTHAIDHRPLVRTAYVLLVVIVLFCLYALLSPKKISNSIWRGLLPAAEVPLATRTEILSVSPGDVTIPAHTQLVDIQVDLGGEIPQQVLMLYTTADGKFNRQPVELRVESEGQTRFKGQLIGENAQGLMQDVSYVIRAGDAESASFRITVEQPPSAEIESIRIEYPQYMKKDPLEYSQNGQIDAWEGAKVVVTAKTNMRVRAGMIQFLDDPQVGPNGEEIPMSVTSGGRQLQASWTLGLRSDGTFPKYYRIDCRTEDGRRDTAPTIHSLTIRPDLPPDVVLLQPDQDLDAPANATIPLLIQASDPDFELGYLYLNAEKGGQKILHEIISEGRQPKLLLKQDLVLSKLKAATGELIEFWIEAYDNKQPRPNTRNTPKIKIRVLDPVTKKEADQQLADQTKRVDEKLAEVEQETNPDALDKPSQPDDQTKEGTSQKDLKPNESDPAQDKNSDSTSSDDAQNQKPDGQSSDQNNKNVSDNPEKDSRQSQAKSKTDNSANNNSRNSDSKQESKPNKPLSADGSQDDEAIKRLSEKLNKDSKKPENQPPKSSDTKTAEEPSPSKPEDDPAKPKPATESSKTSDKDEPHPDAAEKDQPAPADRQKETPTDAKKRPNDEKNSEKTPDSDQQKTGKPNPDQPDPKSDPQKVAETDENKPEKSDEMKSDEAPSEKADKPKKERKNQDPSEEKASEKSDDTKPEKSKTKTEREASDESEEPGAEQKQTKKPDSAKDDQGPGTNPDQQAGKSDTERDSSDKDNKTGEPSPDKSQKDDLPTGMNEKAPKTKSDTKPESPKQKPNGSDSESNPDGPGEPAPDSPDAKKKPGDGTEEGPAKPDRDPKENPNRTKNENVKRDPAQKPETRPGDTPDDTKPKNTKEKPAKSGDQRKPDSGKEKTIDQDPNQKPDEQPNEMKENGPEKAKPGSKNPSEKSKEETGSDADGDGEKQQDQKNPGSKSSKEKETKSKEDQNKQDQGPSETDSPAGDKSAGKPGKKSDRDAKSSQTPPDGDKSGSKSDSKPGASKPGEKSGSDQNPDDSKQTSDKTGSDKAGDKKGSDSKSDGKKSDSKSQNDQDGQGKGDKPGQGGGSGKPSGQPGGSGATKPGPSNGDPTGGGGEVSDGDGTATQGGETSPVEPGEEANMEYNRQATELILQKLKKELERGEVDPELLEQLGWNQEEMKQFADRLSRYLEESKRSEESPEAKARQQQFQEMLKNLDLQKSGAQRSGEKEPKRDVMQIESKRTPVPPAYRSAYEKFTRDLAKQKGNQGKKN